MMAKILIFTIALYSCGAFPQAIQAMETAEVDGSIHKLMIVMVTVKPKKFLLNLQPLQRHKTMIATGG